MVFHVIILGFFCILIPNLRRKSYFKTIISNIPFRGKVCNFPIWLSFRLAARAPARLDIPALETSDKFDRWMSPFLAGSGLRDRPG